MRIRYSRWDGTQRIDDLDADDLLAAMADDLTADGDLWKALRRLFQRGMHNPHGPQMPGLQDLLQQLRQRRQQQLDRYDLGSALEDIKKKLEQVIQTEREGLRRLPDQGAPGLRVRRPRGGAAVPGAAHVAPAADAAAVPPGDEAGARGHDAARHAAAAGDAEGP